MDKRFVNVNELGEVTGFSFSKTVHEDKVECTETEFENVIRLGVKELVEESEGVFVKVPRFEVVDSVITVTATGTPVRDISV
jgi:hypothetical protein